jgi:hypothetical protein
MLPLHPGLTSLGYRYDCRVPARSTEALGVKNNTSTLDGSLIAPLLCSRSFVKSFDFLFEVSGTFSIKEEK